MAKLYSYKNTDEFGRKVLGLKQFDLWRISCKVKLVKLIIDERVNRNISQKELALRLSTTQSVISRIESGLSKNITIDYLLKVVSALGIPPKETLKLVA
jgi:DNA-binding Xre family transcriptional regulator